MKTRISILVLTCATALVWAQENSGESEIDQRYEMHESMSNDEYVLKAHART